MAAMKKLCRTKVLKKQIEDLETNTVLLRAQSVLERLRPNVAPAPPKKKREHLISNGVAMALTDESSRALLRTQKEEREEKKKPKKRKPKDANTAPMTKRSRKKELVFESNPIGMLSVQAAPVAQSDQGAPRHALQQLAIASNVTVAHAIVLNTSNPL